MMRTKTLQRQVTWAEDRALLRSNPSAAPGAKIEAWAAGFPEDAAHLPLRDWHQSDKPKRPQADYLVANYKQSQFQFTLNQDR